MTTMSRNAKIGIGVVAAAVAACLCVCLCGAAMALVMTPNLVGQITETDPQKVRTAAAQIADYELPAGYHELAAMNILTVKMVMIGPAETIAQAQTQNLETMIVIAQVASREMMDDPQLREQVRRSVEQGFRNTLLGDGVDWQETDSRPMTIAGQEVMVRTYEGVGQDGETLRQLLTDVFDGKNGATFVMVQGREAAWPKDAIEAFLTSIH